MSASHNSLDSTTPIEALQLSTRLYNRLKRNDIHRVGDLILLTEGAFACFRHVQPDEWSAIQVALAATGLTRDAVPIEHLQLPVRVQHLLRQNGIASVGHLLPLSTAAFLHFPQSSTADLAAVQHALARYGLSLGTDTK